MAKHRHRTFEMFDFPEEAARALGSKATRSLSDADKPETWLFHQLFTTRTATVIHVRFKERQGTSETDLPELKEDFAKLADSLVNDSQVMIDFDGISEFSHASIDALETLNGKLKTKGSRLTLCNLVPSVQSSFFPHRKTNEESK